MTKQHRSELLRELKSEFPDLAPSLNAEQGQLYFEVEAFRQFAQRAVIDGDRERTAQCFAIADRYFRLGNSEMRQIIDTAL